MTNRKIYGWLTLGLTAWGLVGVSGCSKTAEGVKRYLGMKTSPPREFQRKRPATLGVATSERGDVRLPPAIPPKAGREAPRSPGLPAPGEPRAAAQAPAPTLNPAFRGAALKIADRITEALPAARGYVVEAGEGLVYLSLSVRDEIKEGTILNLVRKGREFKHPLTGKVLGTFEDNIGVLKVVQVKEGYSVAETISLRKGKKVEVGDMVRITSARAKLTVLPFYAQSGAHLDTQALTSELIKSLKKTERFDLYDIDTLKVWMLERDLKPRDLSREAVLKKVLDGIPSEWYLVNSVRELKGVKVVESRLISSYTAERGEPIIVARAVMESRAPQEKAPEPLPAQAPRATRPPPPVRQPVAEPRAASSRGGDLRGKRAYYQGEYWTSRKFKFEIMGLDVGDVDGDGDNELVLAARDRVEILKWDGGEFQHIHTYSRGRGDNFFMAIDLADINGNGREEVYVTNFVEEEVRSFVLEIVGNRLKVLQDNLFQFLRVVDLPGQQPILLSQWIYPGQEGKPLIGKVARYGWKGRKLKKVSTDGALKEVPRKFNIYSLTLGDLDGDGVEDVITLSDSGKLGLYDRKGELLWESSDTYGGKIVRLRAQDSMLEDPGMTPSEEYIKKTSPVNVRMLLRDLDGDGMTELIVPRNVPALGGPLKGIGGYGNSYLMGLRWNGVTLVEDWQTEKTGGYVTDISMADVDNDGEDELVAAVAFRTGFIKMGRDSAVYIFEFLWQ